MGILKAELDKVRRLGWTYLAILGMNAFSGAMFLIFLILYLKSSALDDVAKASVEMERQALTLLYFVFVTETWVFSFLGVFLFGILIGELVGREFDSGAVGLLFMSPFTRLSTFVAKLISVLLVYFISLGLNLSILMATVFILSRVHSVFLRIIDPMVIFKLLGAQVLIDISWIGLMFLVSTMSRGVASTLAYTIFIYFFLLFVDAVIWLGAQFQFIGPWLVKAGAFTFTNSCRVLDSQHVGKYFTRAISDFPLAFNLLGLNVAYTFVFLLLAAYAFSKREI
jgi:ABC-type transport system involved in multi-copper enzyme maturation permease subunit